MSQRDHHADNRIGSVRTGILVLAVCLLAGYLTGRWSHDDPEPEPLHMAWPAMGTVVEMTVPGEGSDDGLVRASEAVHAAMAEVARVDSLFSWRLPAPVQTAAAQRATERAALLDVGLDVLRVSDGAFDPRMRPLIRIWGFDGDEPAVPDPGALAAETARLQDLSTPVDAAELETRPETLHFGAWAKGYAVDRALAVLREHGEGAALVNAGGEVRGYGRPWTVGVQHPRLPGAILAQLQPGDLAVATSGDYEQYFEQDGVRYHHLLDPRNGRPARGCRSVTVLAASCARADALATAVFVLGPQDGMDLVERLVGVECLIIDADGDRHDSSGLDAYLSGE